jgi:hypothetical protein
MAGVGVRVVPQYGVGLIYGYFQQGWTRAGASVPLIQNSETTKGT